MEARFGPRRDDHVVHPTMGRGGDRRALGDAVDVLVQCKHLAALRRSVLRRLLQCLLEVPALTVQHYRGAL